MTWATSYSTNTDRHSVSYTSARIAPTVRLGLKSFLFFFFPRSNNNTSEDSTQRCYRPRGAAVFISKRREGVKKSWNKKKTEGFEYENIFLYSNYDIIMTQAKRHPNATRLRHTVRASPAMMPSLHFFPLENDIETHRRKDTHNKTQTSSVLLLLLLYRR